MHRVEAQRKQAQQKPAIRHGGASRADSPQGAQLKQLQATLNSSPQVEKQRNLATTINASPAMSVQRKFFEGIHNSPTMIAQCKHLASLFGTAQRVEDEEPLQRKLSAQTPTQLEQQSAAKPNNTGLPDNLKSGIESLSGMSMDNVKVHYNSSQPAQLNALAYAQGTDIHVAPGQEQHLPHEAWHVVQQAQGRVRPTMQMKDGVPVNDDQGLEREADVMGIQAMYPATTGIQRNRRATPDTYKCSSGTTIQRAIGFEFETNAKLKNENRPYKYPLHDEGWDGKQVTSYGPGWHAHVDGGKVEFATQPVETKDQLITQIGSLMLAAENMENTLTKSSKKDIPFHEAINLGSCTESLTTKARNKNLYDDGIYADIQNTISLELSKVPRFYEQMSNSAKTKSYDQGVSHKIYEPRHLTPAVKGLNLPAPHDVVNAHITSDIINDKTLWRKLKEGEYEGVSPDVGEVSTIDLSWLDSYEGIATIIVDYLNNFVPSNLFENQSDYVKSDFPLLQRVSFVEMIKSLNMDTDGQKLINTLLPSLVVIWVNKLTNLNNDKNGILKTWHQTFQRYKDSDNLNDFLNALPTICASQNMRQNHLPSVGNWLSNVLSGKDMLSYSDNKNLDSESMGNLDMDTVGKTPKTIIENRSLQTRELVGKWGDVANKVFEDYEKKIS